jgi:transcriptional regulator of acetoin/glycerol metabolism
VGTQVDATTVDDSQAHAAGPPVAQAHLFRVIDCSRPLGRPARHSLRGVDEVRLGRGPSGAERLGEGGARVLRITEPDARISTAHARLRHHLGRWLIEDLGSRNGTWLGGEAVRDAALADGDLIELGRTFYLFRAGVPTAADEPPDVFADPEGTPGLETLHPPLARALRALAAIAPSMVSVVIQGETGTGKELVARAVHGLSGRRGPFVAVNCGAIPEPLIESELFGVRRGAYSDAKEDRPGLIRSADRGTLFLDEIGDLKVPLQTAFLRVLQEREVMPIGQAKALPVDVRVVSASHRDLERLTAAGGFRDDLWARLSGFTIRLPALRERPEDLGLLVAALVRRLAEEPERISFHPDAMRRLLRHAWPRNVRELEKRLGAALVLAGGRAVQVEHLGDWPAENDAPAAGGDPSDPRREELERLLREHAGNLSAVARALDKDRVQIRRWVRRYRLDPARFR